MIPYKCVVKPPHSDCMRCCIASILNIRDPETVPHWYADGNPHAFQAMKDWLARHNLQVMTVGYDGAMSPFKARQIFGANNPGLFYLMAGEIHGGNHVVVCQGGDVVCNPSWYPEEFDAPIDGHWIFFVLVPIIYDTTSQ